MNEHNENDSTLKQRFGSMAVVHSSSPPWPRATTTRETLAPEPSGSRRSSSPRPPEPKPGAAPATLKRRRLGIHGRHHPSSAGGPRAGPFGAPATRQARLPRPSRARVTAGREVLHRDITLHGAEPFSREAEKKSSPGESHFLRSAAERAWNGPRSFEWPGTHSPVPGLRGRCTPPSRGRTGPGAGPFGRGSVSLGYAE